MNEVEDNGVVFSVSSATVGADLKLKRNAIGKSWSYNCHHCGSKQTVAVSEFNTEAKVGQVREYANLANETRDIQSSKDVLSYMIQRSRILKKHRFGMPRLLNQAQFLFNGLCEFCKKDNPLTVSVAATGVVYGIPVIESGKLYSEIAPDDLDMETTESDIDIQRLILGKELVESYKKLPLNLKEYKQLIHRLNWESEKPAEECAKEFELRLKAIHTDLTSAAQAIEECIGTLEKTKAKFSSENSIFIVNDLISKLRNEVKGKLERKLRRLLAENLLWLNAQVERIELATESEEPMPEVYTVSSHEEGEELAKKLGKPIRYRIR